MITMVQDNALKVSLNMGQRGSAGDLSNTTLSIEYPNIDRDAANIAQFELIMAQLKSVMSLTLGSPRVQENPEMAEAYTTWIRVQGNSLLALADQMGNIARK